MQVSEGDSSRPQSITSTRRNWMQAIVFRNTLLYFILCVARQFFGGNFFLLLLYQSWDFEKWQASRFFSCDGCLILVIKWEFWHCFMFQKLMSLIYLVIPGYQNSLSSVQFCVRVLMWYATGFKKAATVAEFLLDLCCLHVDYFNMVVCIIFIHSCWLWCPMISLRLQWCVLFVYNSVYFGTLFYLNLGF